MGSEVKSRAVPFWALYRHQLLLMALGILLVVFLVRLPGEARAALVAALWAQRVLVGLVCAFTIVAVTLVWSVGQQFDTRVFVFFNLHGYRSDWLDQVVMQMTQLGSMVAAFAAAGLLYLLHLRRVAMEIVLGTITVWLVVEVVKLLTRRNRPFIAVEGARLVGWRERGGSFPSGHTTQTFFLVTLLAHRFQQDIVGIIALYAFAVLIGLTRIYVGAHYPRDVIAGAFLGTAWGVLAALVDPYWLSLRF
jgi:membrane-associated phospholipid phosphatase